MVSCSIANRCTVCEQSACSPVQDYDTGGAIAGSTVAGSGDSNVDMYRRQRDGPSSFSLSRALSPALSLSLSLSLFFSLFLFLSLSLSLSLPLSVSFSLSVSARVLSHTLSPMACRLAQRHKYGKMLTAMYCAEIV